MNAIYIEDGVWYIQREGDSTLYTPVAGSCSKKQDGTLISISNSPNINFSGFGDIFNRVEVTTIAKNSEGDTFASITDFNNTTKDFFVEALGSGGLPHEKSAIPYWGTISELKTGWQICDGTNGTPDLRSQFIRGASSDEEVGNEVDYKTARPSTSFVTEAKTVSLSSNTGSNNASHTHTHNHEAVTATTTETSFSNGRELIASSESVFDAVIDYGSNAEGLCFDGSTDPYRTRYTHDHEVTINLPSKTSGTQSANHQHSMSHSHAVGEQEITSGGDEETAPQHILMYWITYTGALAPNWE